MSESDAPIETVSMPDPVREVADKTKERGVGWIVNKAKVFARKVRILSDPQTKGRQGRILMASGVALNDIARDMLQQQGGETGKGFIDQAVAWAQANPREAENLAVGTVGALVGGAVGGVIGGDKFALGGLVIGGVGGYALASVRR